MTHNGAELWRLMRESGITQRFIAEETGLTRSAISCVVRGYSKSEKVIRAIRKALADCGATLPPEVDDYLPMPACDEDPDITAGPWVAIGDYEVNLYGLVRRTTNSRALRKGGLLRPGLSKYKTDSARYYLRVKNEKLEMLAPDLVRYVHGRDMISVDGWTEKVLALVYRQRGAKHKRNASDKKASSGRRGNYTRCCHDCGRPTNQYRCDACWSKLRRSAGNCHTEADFGGRCHRSR